MGLNGFLRLTTVMGMIEDILRQIEEPMIVYKLRPMIFTARKFYLCFANSPQKYYL
jgi:hypothetical protein